MKKENDKARWKELARRYFDCTATDAEERQLMRYVAGNDDPDFDDVRAVMGYAAWSRRRTRKPAGVRLRWVAAVASVVIIAGAVAIYNRQSPDCVAYDRGRLITDKGHVMQMMHSTVGMMVSEENGESAVKTQLSDMLGTLDERE